MLFFLLFSITTFDLSDNFQGVLCQVDFLKNKNKNYPPNLSPTALPSCEAMFLPNQGGREWQKAKQLHLVRTDCKSQGRRKSRRERDYSNCAWI